ncbi:MULTISPECIES: amidohydrolase family protein [unclassified Variovorax]|nr:MULTISPECIES: amidohydrolase family protein [Pseudomonadota]PNG59707.1 4-sulfomuconolactone hydrolase [Variovorax sp. B4]PNG60502.1 4-sulfomuconolactone hydrolase [Variovorax sp. B2]VTV13615.1 putative metal-dependent hydrolase of the TIM-barrel fold protein [Variovorax sp. WDL1]
MSHEGSVRDGADAPPCTAPLAEIRRPRFELPSDACDCHLHILGPATDFPYVQERVYTPPDCLLPDYDRVRDYLGATRCVLVQPSVYGHDNRVLLAALQAVGERARGVVVLRGDEATSELARMHSLGVRGARLNLVDLQTPCPRLPQERMSRLAEMIRPLGWHLELLMHVDQYPDMASVLGDLGVPLVFGHMGYLSRNVADEQHPGMQAMLDLARAQLGWIKVTAPYRLADPPNYARAARIARWLAAVCPDQLVWGSDWPHVMVRTAMPHDADLLDQVAEWIPDREHQVALFSTNARRLYGWPP